ncbi:MAG: outer membrane protein assembly factor BamD [Candidatus Omnitrophica bacterium]|nr:outer membrane protein assembly factor BamD [Candidatus Omnitrophota bacterium]MDD5351744.1 outer membrane protein assembly factor BamD [Candidatus Omnitrophota bacterium]MDD5550955.1 outer membrane protein assembly factor BamD [Candidatus Omnitrophota bacterium]
MRRTIIITFIIFFCAVNASYAFWLWNPKTKEFTNPQWTVKDSPKAQLQFAKEVLNTGNYKNALVEFRNLLRHYPESQEASDAQFYVGECLEKMDKPYDAYLAYQKVIDKYAFNTKMDEVLQREFNIANTLADAKVKILGLDFPQYYYAITIYRKIIENSPYSKLAPLSQYKIGLVLKTSGDFAGAKKEFEKVISTYPDSEWVEASKFQLAKSASLVSLDADYDQEATKEAKDRYEEFVSTHPEAELSKEAKEEIVSLTDKEAEKDFNVGQYYEKQKTYTSAGIYYEDVISKYPKSVWAQRSLERIQVLKKEGKL